jgi:hypothetical protein
MLLDRNKSQSQEADIYVRGTVVVPQEGIQ